MEKLIQNLGNLFYRFFKKREKFSWTIQKSQGKMILFLLCVFAAPFGFFIALGIADSWNSRMYVFFGYLLISFLVILIIGGWYNGLEKFKKDKHGLRMRKLNIFRKDTSRLLFDEEDLENLFLLINGYAVKSKICNRHLVKNGSSANYYFVFSVMNMLVQDGIIDPDTERRKLIFEIIQNSWSMNGAEVNENTLDSSFSRWNSEMKNSDKVILVDQIVKESLIIE